MPLSKKIIARLSSPRIKTMRSSWRSRLKLLLICHLIFSDLIFSDLYYAIAAIGESYGYCLIIGYYSIIV